MNYLNFIKTIKNKKYNFIFYENIKPNKNKQIILRHDVDFDIDYAVNIAKIEKKLNIKSTYFFLLRSFFYNLIRPENIYKIKLIKSLGHKISLHFDPSIYPNEIDLKEGLKFEKKIFENIFKVKIKIISFHKPHKKYYNSNKKILGLNHTYMNKFTKKIRYFSDSQNKFRFGCIFDSEEFKNNLNLQVLIHPVWWQNFFGQNSSIIIKNLLKKKLYKIDQNLIANLSFYKKNR